MKKKTIIGIAGGLAVIAFLMFTILCFHLYAVAKKPKANNLQLSRIDFKEAVDSTDAMNIKSFVGHLEGIKGTHFNIAQGTLVYGYFPGTMKPEEVFEKVMDFSKHKYKAQRFVLSADQIGKGCPAGMDNSFTSALSKLLLKIFN